MSQKFTLGAILSITTPFLMVKDFNEVEAFLSYMIGRDVSTISAIRAAEIVAPELLRQHPFLSRVKLIKGDVTESNYKQVLRDIATKHNCGMELECAPIKKGV